jgi:hypothetical protein
VQVFEKNAELQDSALIVERGLLACLRQMAGCTGTGHRVPPARGAEVEPTLSLLVEHA